MGSESIDEPGFTHAGQLDSVQEVSPQLLMAVFGG